MLHTFVALVPDKPGVLTRVASALVLAISPALLMGQTAHIHIRMVDGRNGHPWVKKHIEVYDATSDPRYLPKTLFEGETDKYGVFALDLSRNQRCGFSAIATVLKRTDVGTSMESRRYRREWRSPGELLQFQDSCHPHTWRTSRVPPPGNAQRNTRLIRRKHNQIEVQCSTHS